MNKLVFITFFLLQMTNVIIFSSQDKADLFIQRFPRLTFPQAKELFGNLSIARQRSIWHKLDINKKDKNKILPLALRMAHIEPTLQYAILSENFTILEKRKSDETIEDYNKRISVPHKIYTDSICDLFRWKAIIDTKCGEKKYLKLLMPMSGYHTQIPKATLFDLTIDHVKTIQNAQKNVLTKEKIQLLAKLPDDLLEVLKPFYKFKGSNEYRTLQIKFFYYKNPTITSALIKVLDTAVFILPPLLYYRFYIRPSWNAITGTQDPLALTQNAAKELHNQTIDHLKQAGIDGSEHLMKQLIKPVPFELSWLDRLATFKQIIGMAPINVFLINHFSINDERPNNKPKPSLIWYTINQLFNYIKDRKNTDFFDILIFLVLQQIIIGPITALFTTNLLYYNDPFVSSLTLPEAIIGCIGLSAAIALMINTIQNLKPTPYWKSIDFSKEKFKDKSVKECINYYLHHPTIIMKKK